jgi:hypothetical protein
MPSVRHPAPKASALPLLQARRYVQPLREGGSLPAIVDTENGLFVVKFRGAGQGPKALIAELLVGMLARVLGLPVPDLALVNVAQEFGRAEPDPEIQDILRGSHGINFGIRYLDGAFNFDAHAAADLIAPELAADIVWFDGWLTNPDRTHRNPNLLICERRPFLIDHGAAIYVHHDWTAADEARVHSPFPRIRDHVLLTRADDVQAADARLAPRLHRDLLDMVLSAIPDALLDDRLAAHAGESPAASRSRYRDYLLRRLEAPRAFVAEAVRARAERLNEAPQHLSSRR